MAAVGSTYGARRPVPAHDEAEPALERRSDESCAGSADEEGEEEEDEGTKADASVKSTVSSARAAASRCAAAAEAEEVATADWLDCTIGTTILPRRLPPAR